MKQKTISEKTAEINTIEKDFKNSTDRESRLELLKSTIQESKDYTKSKKIFFLKYTDQIIKTLISSNAKQVCKRVYSKLWKKMPLSDIGTSDDIDTLANHKDNLNNLLTTIERKKNILYPIIQIIKNILKSSSYIEAYTNRITDIEEKAKRRKLKHKRKQRKRLNVKQKKKQEKRQKKKQQKLIMRMNIFLLMFQLNGLVFGV